ncbi:DUF3560 domain-containing protein [Streptomyces antibioticus]|uniref:DUF3560 domain-containing protein n=1 Tax=Streptomyces antibioticus TaxID=1890 RepID=UPI0033C72DFC
MTATTRPASTRTPVQEPTPASAEVPARTAPTAEQPRTAEARSGSLPRNLGRLTAQAEETGWTATVETHPGHCALLLTAPQEAGQTVLRCVWRLTARGYRWDGATLTRYGKTAVQGIAWRAVADLVTAEAPTARTQPTPGGPSLPVHGTPGAHAVMAGAPEPVPAETSAPQRRGCEAPSVEVERACRAAEEWPEAMEARSLGDRYEGEFRRSDLLSELSVCGERFPFRFHFESGGGHTVALPTGDVRGTWGEVTGAAIAYVIAERPASVLRATAETARVYALQAERAQDRAEENARAAVSVGMARAALDTVRAFAQRIDWDGLTDEQYDSARGAIREAEQGAERAESAYGPGDVDTARWAARDALAVVRWFGLDVPSAQECARRAPEPRAVPGRVRPHASAFLLRITRPGWEGPAETAGVPAGSPPPAGSGVTPDSPAEGAERSTAAEADPEPATSRGLTLPEEVAEAEEGAADIVIRHTHEDGTTVEGSARGDGVWEALRPLGWTYRRVPGIFIRGSRYKSADRWKINRAADAVRALGLSCAVVVEEGMTFAEREAARVDAAEERGERYADRAGRAAASSQAARDTSDRIGERFWMGQPILVGHHSEGRARRDQERMDNAMRKSIGEGERAGYWASRAAAAHAYERYRKNPGRTLRRIEKLEAERRGVLRERDGVDDKGRKADVWWCKPSETRREELTRRLAEYDEELTYWAETIKEAERRGFKVWGKPDFVRGDFALWRGSWYEVARVNAKTVTVPHIHAAYDGGAVGAVGGRRVITGAATAQTRHKGSTYTLAYNEVSGRMSAEQMRAALAGEPIPADPRDVPPEPTPEEAEAERAADAREQSERQDQDAPAPVASTVWTSAPAPAGVSDPGTADAWEGDGGAVPGVPVPRATAALQEHDATAAKGAVAPGGEEGSSRACDADASDMSEEAAQETAEASAVVLAGMPRNAGVIFHEAADAGWDVRAERRWTGRTWVRAVVITGLVVARAGVGERQHVCAWSEDKGSYLGSVSTGGFKAVREAVRGTSPVNREHESTGRTVWGHDAAQWVRQMDGAVSKVTAACADARDAFNALDGSTDTGARAVDLASAAYREARDAERSAVDAVKAARAWLAEMNGADARGCASWRQAVVLAGQHVKEAAERIADATARAEREALAAPVIAEAQERLCSQETAWRARLAESGREPTARGYAGVVVMLEDAARHWCAWFDGYTDYQGQSHAGHGDGELSFVAQYDAWKASRNTDSQVSFPSRFTEAALMAGDRVDAAAVAFTLAVAARIEGRGGDRLRDAAAAVRKNPQGFGTANDRKALADWSKHQHTSYGEPARLAEHAPAEWAALQTAQAAYDGVRDFEAALYWDARYARERAASRREADETGRQGAQSARAERRGAAARPH